MRRRARAARPRRRREAAPGVLDDDDLLGAEQLQAHDERADDVVGHEAAGVADDVGVAGPQAERLLDIEARVHAGDDDQPRQRRGGQRGSVERLGIASVLGEQARELGDAGPPRSSGRWVGQAPAVGTPYRSISSPIVICPNRSSSCSRAIRHIVRSGRGPERSSSASWTPANRSMPGTAEGPRRAGGGVVDGRLRVMSATLRPACRSPGGRARGRVGPGEVVRAAPGPAPCRPGRRAAHDAVGIGERGVDRLVGDSKRGGTPPPGVVRSTAAGVGRDRSSPSGPADVRRRAAGRPRRPARTGAGRPSAPAPPLPPAPPRTRAAAATRGRRRRFAARRRRAPERLAEQLRDVDAGQALHGRAEASVTVRVTLRTTSDAPSLESTVRLSMLAHRLGGRPDDLRQHRQDGLDDGRLVELAVGLGPQRERLRLGLALREDDAGLGVALERRLLGASPRRSPRPTRACASPASLTRSASAWAWAIRACLSPSARRTWASASASAGRTVVATSSCCLRAASSWASSVCLRVTSWVASASASGPAWAARASAAAVWVSVSARRRATSRSALILTWLGLGLADGGLLVGGGLGHPGVALAAGRLLLADQLHVAGLVADGLDRERVDLEARRREVALGRVLDGLLELLAVEVELLDGQRADDRAQRALEDVLDDRVDLPPPAPRGSARRRSGSTRRRRRS